MATQKNRYSFDSFVWGVRGFAGGPLRQLKDLNVFITRGEVAAL